MSYSIWQFILSIPYTIGNIIAFIYYNVFVCAIYAWRRLLYFIPTITIITIWRSIRMYNQHSSYICSRFFAVGRIQECTNEGQPYEVNHIDRGKCYSCKCKVSHVLCCSLWKFPNTYEWFYEKHEKRLWIANLFADLFH